MANGFLAFGMVAVFTVLAMIILAARDSHQQRHLQEQRPIEDRIAEIRENAALMTHELQGVLDQRLAKQPEAVTWIEPLLVYYRRLEALAAAPDSSAEEILLLADEALQYVRQRRLKGIFVAREAEELAALVRRRNAA